MAKALIQAKIVRRPISGDIIGFRLVAAVPNNAGRVMRVNVSQGEVVGFHATQQEAPLFRGAYFIAESSDHVSLNKARIEKFQAELKWFGYGEYELVGRYNGDPLSELML